MQLTERLISSVNLASSFVSIILIIIISGIFLFYLKLPKLKKINKINHNITKMTFLLVSWGGIFALLTLLEYFLGLNNLTNIIFIIFGSIIFLIFLFCIPCFWKEFDRLFLVTAGIFAGVIIFSKIFLLLLKFKEYISISIQALIVVPPLLGIFMIVKRIVDERT